MKNKTKFLLISALSLCTLSAGVTAVMAGAETETPNELNLTFAGASIRYNEGELANGIRFAVQMDTQDWADFNEQIEETYVKISNGTVWGEKIPTSNGWYTVNEEGKYTDVESEIVAYQTVVCLYGVEDVTMNFQVQGFAKFKDAETVVESVVKAEDARSMNFVAQEAIKELDPVEDADKIAGLEAYVADYTVAFEGLEEKQTVKHGKTATAPATQPEKAGFVFKGWNFDFNTAITGNVTVNATWYEEVDMTATNVADFDKSLSTAQTVATTSLGAVEKVVYAGEEVECEIDNEAGTVTFASEVVNAMPNGLNVVEVYTANKIYSVTVTAATKLIDSEADWNEIYNDTAGYYKLVGDVVFDNTGITVDLHGANKNAANFFGVLDGNNKKISGAKYTNRLFYVLYGTVKDLFLETKLGGVGGAISMGMDKTAVIENVRANITLDSASVWKYTDPFWNADNAGGLIVENWGGLIKNCVVYMDLTNTIDEQGKVVADVSTIMTTYTIGGAGAPQNCLSFATTNLWECRDLKGDQGVKKAAFVTVNEMNVGETWQLREGATSYTAKTENVTVDANGLVTATAGGTATIEAVYNGLTVTYTANIWTAIATAADFEKIYSDLDGYYKLTNDITISKHQGVHTNSSANYKAEFSGVLDGNGKTLTWTAAVRLFHTISGTVRNMNVVSRTSNTDWGPALAFALTGTIENVDFDVLFISTWAYETGDGYNPHCNAGIVIYNWGLIKDCNVNATIENLDMPTKNIHGGTADAHGYPHAVENISAICKQMESGGRIENCTATCNVAIKFIYNSPDAGSVTVVTPNA